MSNYRIKKITKGNSEVWYYPQKKILWFWWNIANECCNEWWAHQIVFENYKDTQKDKVEYLAPDISKTVPKTPNPPPKVV